MNYLFHNFSTSLMPSKFSHCLKIKHIFLLLPLFWLIFSPLTFLLFYLTLKFFLFTKLLHFQFMKLEKYNHYKTFYNITHRDQFSSVTQSCLTLCDPINHSTPGLPVHQQLPEFTQTQVHHFGDSIQPAHPLPALSPPAFNLSQHRVFSNESALHIRWPKDWSSASASVLPMNIQVWFPLGWTGWISLQSKGLSSVFSITTVQKHPFFGVSLAQYK